MWRTSFYLTTLYSFLFTSQVLLAEDAKHFMGTGSCSSSNCHGSVSPKNSTNVLQNEYVTWLKHDRHAKAFAVLASEDSQLMAKNLGLGNPQTEALCLRCHSTHLENPKRRGDKYQIEDGVSCESCHGASERWLPAHTARDASYEKNIELGLTKLNNAADMANVCVDCHFGNEEQFVNHRLIGAGHPRLTFELDTFLNLMPKHWAIDEYYKKRKGEYHPARAWFAGQLAVSREILYRLSSKQRSQQGIFPELSMFYCYSCHHDLTSEQWKVRNYQGSPGEPQLNLSSLIVIRQALRAVKPALGDKLEKEMDALNKGLRSGSKDRGLVELQKSLSDKSLSVTDSSQNRNMLKQLTAYAANTPHLQYEVAEQLAMGVSSIMSELSPDGKMLKQEIDALYDSLKDPKRFVAEDFTKAAVALNTAALRI